MKAIVILFALLFVAVVVNAQTVLFVPTPAPSAPSPGYTYYNTVSPSGQSSTGFVYTQPSSPTTGFQQDMTTGEQSTYVTNGSSTVILPLTSGK